MPSHEEASIWPSDNLLLKEGRKHYRSSVSPIHWQLRSLLSAERQNILYFPAGVNNTHIQRLDTSTRECETIKVISFHPRCLVASKGWICCGGENGEVVVMRESGSNDTSTQAQADNLSRDFRSRLNSMEASTLAEGGTSQIQRDMLSVVERLNGPNNKTWSATSTKAGNERVNCITIWHPTKGMSAPGQYDVPVGIVANNDKTIAIVDLTYPDYQRDVIEYPDCVNRGVISPDGLLLVAICDDPYLYIHRRIPHTSQFLGETFKWSKLPRIRLKGQWNKDTTDCRGSFAACFSPSGKYLAVGTQYGTISIFDAVALRNPDSDPLITYFDSDRAPSECGAVRDMAFSPGPHDLLAWSEHRGRIGIADARTNFMRRQIISLHDSHNMFDHFSLNDGSTIDPRLLDPRSERDPESDRNMEGDRAERPLLSLLDRWGRLMSDRSRPNPEPSTTTRYNQPYSPDEMQVLNALQSTRQQRETHDRDQPEPRLPEHRHQRGPERWRSPPGWAERHATMTRIIERERMRESRDQHRLGISQTPPEQDRERVPGTGREQRRRSASIMYTLAQNADNISQMMANRASGQAGESNDGPTATATSQGRASSPWFSGRMGGWADIESSAMMYGSEGGTRDDSRAESSRVRRGIPVIADVWTNDSLFSRIRTGSREHQQNPDDTAGLAWSEDGQVLYVAAEDGIYELPVNMHGRKVFPDISLR
ncbi:uncharacterized protein F4822DRAFT_422254 [Hypoxylon trugodes]|uniref:uncharacterized protein n=1 Tax=Hypoxylon trugodes TaxID=326681 RepID=UPI00219D054F|nr:uncharacterized protein F4822DRAFT_422254 [Hypoxylon trugodes]KAI1383134.1 hypothetical protein F4822DRAFT_422254 [Hypoxylon trugodes]